jgi:hypothetical protein
MGKIGRGLVAVLLAGLLMLPSVGVAGTMTASVTERQNFSRGILASATSCISSRIR